MLSDIKPCITYHFKWLLRNEVGGHARKLDACFCLTGRAASNKVANRNGGIFGIVREVKPAHGLVSPEVTVTVNRPNNVIYLHIELRMRTK